MRRQCRLDCLDSAVDHAVLVPERPPQLGLELNLAALTLALDLALGRRCPGIDGSAVLGGSLAGEKRIGPARVANRTPDREPPEVVVLRTPRPGGAGRRPPPAGG